MKPNWRLIVSRKFEPRMCEVLNLYPQPTLPSPWPPNDVSSTLLKVFYVFINLGQTIRLGSYLTSRVGLSNGANPTRIGRIQLSTRRELGYIRQKCSTVNLHLSYWQYLPIWYWAKDTLDSLSSIILIASSEERGREGERDEDSRTRRVH